MDVPKCVIKIIIEAEGRGKNVCADNFILKGGFVDLMNISELGAKIYQGHLLFKSCWAVVCADCGIY